MSLKACREAEAGVAVEQPIHLCIGLPRTGTTWLFNNLSRQPGVFTPAIKEVRYWVSRRNLDQISNEAARARARLDKLHDIDLQAQWLDNWCTINPAEEPNGDVYASMMRVAGKPSIDISPVYSIMPPHLIKEVAKAIPESSKVILFARDPMSRLTSQMKLHWYLHGRFRGLASPERHAEFLARPTQLHRCDYAQIVENWGGEFGDRFKMFFYEDMNKDQQKFLHEVCDFLELPLDEEIALKSSTQVFGTNKGYARPHPGAEERKQIATALMPLVDRFAALEPARARPWKNKLIQAMDSVVPQKEVIEDMDLKVQDLMRMTESLGENCEYGFWQRHRNYEPSSLFRWAITPPESLLAYLRNPGPMFFEENIDVHSPGMVNDSTFGFKFHSKLVEPSEDGDLRLVDDKARWDEIYKQEKEKNEYLVYKFDIEARQKPCVYIIKRNKGVSRDTVEEVRDLLVARNPLHKLLWVEKGENCGQIEEIGPNLLYGQIDAFARYITADAYSPNGWTSLMKSLAARDDITRMINQMEH